MNSSRMIATRKRGVFMAHICSECGFPMITVVQIEAEAQKTYTFSQSKAEQIASDTAENAISGEIRRIKSCYNRKSVLDGKQKDSGMNAPGCFCTSSFSGHISQCPKCLNIEPWKTATSKKSMSELNKDNFPTVFTNPVEAEKWAFGIVKNMAEECTKKREDDSAVNDAVEDVINTKIKINEWLKDMNSISEEPERNRLKDELSNAEKLKSHIGLLDFKNKKAVNKKISFIRLKINDLNEIIEKKTTPIAEKIIKLGNELLVTQSIAFGCSDDVLTKKSGNAISYFLSPNDIPDDILSWIEDANGSTSQSVTEPQEDSLLKHDSCLEVEKTVFCRKCGYKLLADSTFCTKCGMKVE